MRDAGHRTPDIGRRTSDGAKSKNNISTPQGGGHDSHLCLITVIQSTRNNMVRTKYIYSTLQHLYLIFNSKIVSTYGIFIIFHSVYIIPNLFNYFI